MDDLQKEARAHFNEPVLIDLNLCRLIGYGEDDEDCYLIVRDPRRKGLRRCTCVGGYTYLDALKGRNRCRSKTGGELDDFTRLDSLLALNGAPKEPDFFSEVSTSVLERITGLRAK